MSGRGHRPIFTAAVNLLASFCCGAGVAARCGLAVCGQVSGPVILALRCFWGSGLNLAACGHICVGDPVLRGATRPYRCGVALTPDQSTQLP